MFNSYVSLPEGYIVWMQCDMEHTSEDKSHKHGDVFDVANQNHGIQ